MKRFEDKELGCCFVFSDDTPEETIQRVLSKLGHRPMCSNTLWGKQTNAWHGLQQEPEEAMEQATGQTFEDWEEYCKYLEGKLPLERDRE